MVSTTVYVGARLLPLEPFLFDILSCVEHLDIQPSIEKARASHLALQKLLSVVQMQSIQQRNHTLLDKIVHVVPLACGLLHTSSSLRVGVFQEFTLAGAHEEGIYGGPMTGILAQVGSGEIESGSSCGCPRPQTMSSMADFDSGTLKDSIFRDSR